MLIMSLLSVLSGIIAVAQASYAAGRAIRGALAKRRRHQVIIARCAIDGRPAPSIVSREFGKWENSPEVGLICPECQRHRLER